MTFRMLDAGVAAVSSAGVWRVLSRAGLLSKRKGQLSGKGTGFEQPPGPHPHWPVDVSSINVHGTFYHRCSVPDGNSRSMVHWDLRERMGEADMEIMLEQAGGR